MMRKNYLWAPMALVLGVVACESTVLEEEPGSFLTVGNFYSTAREARAANLSVYQSIATIFSSGFLGVLGGVGEAMSDHANAHPADQNAAIQEPGNLSWGTANTFFVNSWTALWATVYRANLVLDRVPGTTMADSEKEQILAEAKFLRGWMYLNIVRFYGPVPILLSLEDHTNPEPTPSPIADVHDQILKDLTEAEASLPLSRPRAEWGRVTKGAARMALAEAYLWRSSTLNSNEWQKAADAAKSIIDSNQYALNADFLSTFLPSNKANSEMIWVRTATGIQNRSSSDLQNRDYPRELSPGGGSAIAEPTDYAYNVEGQQGQPGLWTAAGDYRRDVSFRVGGCNLPRTVCFAEFPQGPHPFKFRPTDQSNNGRGDVDQPFYRYAETLLYYAEALNELGRTDEAIGWVNQVRARARKGANGTEARPQPANLPNGLSKAQAREAIYKEREMELLWETKRWLDLIRRDGVEPGYFVSQLTRNDPATTRFGPVANFRKLIPIPQPELDLAPSLGQNPGY